MITFHLLDNSVLKNAPDYVFLDYLSKGLNGARCGYVRKNTTTNVSKVTCKLCLKKLRQHVEYGGL